MANTHRIVRSLMTVFLDTSGTEPFDFANLEPVALAQSYTLDVVKNTQSLTPNDLADPTGTAQWNLPEPTDKGWTLTTDALVLIADADEPEYDPLGKVATDALLTAFKADILVWVAIVDSDAGSGDVVPIYGLAHVTGYSQNGNIDEWHTATLSLEGSGELLDTLTITP